MTRSLVFHQRILEGGGVADILGAATSIIAGGNALNVTITGLVRLPLTSTGCDSCLGEKQTWLLNGTLQLERLHARNDFLHGTMRANAHQARIDEAVVSPIELGLATSATVAAASVVFILKFLLAPFFTRLTKEQALEHPRRKQIFDYIRDHPGANFREVARNTGIAAGTVRHHLNVLERSGQVVEHSHGSTVRLFENHGKFDQTWSDMVLLREPALGKLHEWLKANPNAPQKAVLEAMEAESWSRSTTQHRLSRLVDGGVVTIRLQGRLKLYSVVEKSIVAKAPGLPAPNRALPV